jgi:hypothetical protein
MTPRLFTSGLFGLGLAGGLFAVVLYASRYWPVQLWSRDGLFGIGWLPPGGDVLRHQMNALWRSLGIRQLEAFDVLIWGLAIFGFLSILQWIWTAAVSIRSRK